MAKLDVFVVGATGPQGSAVARALLQGGHNVRALTRNLAHPAADSLRLRGARLAWASLEDERRLREALTGMDAVFAVTTARGHGAAAEVQQGLLLAQLAQDAGVSHFVYSSLPGAVAVSGVPESDSKHEIERFLSAARIPHTVISPTFFMENLLLPPWLAGLRSGRLPLPVPPGRKLQQIAVADVGRFVRIVLERPDRFANRRVPIASDELTPIEMAATLARITGQCMEHSAGLPADEAGAVHVAAMYAWTSSNGASADVVGLRRDFPEVNWHTLYGWAELQDWSPLAHAT